MWNLFRVYKLLYYLEIIAYFANIAAISTSRKYEGLDFQVPIYINEI